MNKRFPRAIKSSLPIFALSVFLFFTNNASAFSNPSVNPAGGAGSIYIEASTPANTFYLKSNGSVGVGNTNPTEKLDVTGDVYIAGTGSTIGRATLANGSLRIGTTLAMDPNEFYFGTTAYFGTVGANDLYIDTNGATRMTVTAGGNIGIGKTPSTALDVNGTVTATAFAGPLSGSISSANVSAGSFGSNTGGGNYFFPASLGVGTISPGSQLNVGTKTTNSSSTVAMFGKSAAGAEAMTLSLVNSAPGATNNSVSVGFHNGDAWSPTGKIEVKQAGVASTDSSMNFYTYTSGLNNRMTLDYQGYLGIGTTAPAAKLDVNGTAYVPQLFINRSSGAGRGISWYSPTYTSWTDYMCSAGQTGCGPTANITAPAGTLVTTWGQRSFIENSAGYGWTFESGTSAGQPAVVAEIRSSDGSAKFNGTVTANAFTGPLTGTTSAANVSSGSFGANTGGGNYTFPASLIVPTPGGSWISGKDGTVGLNAGTAQSASAFHPFIRQTTSSGHKIVLGGLGDSFGFYGYDANRTVNGYDYYLTMNLANGSISTGGNLGVGTASPTTKLEVQAAAGGPMASTAIFGGNGANAAITINSAGTSNYAYQTFAQGGTGKWEMGATGDGNSNFYLNPNVQNGYTGAALSILRNGNVGISNTAPAYKLDVTGGARATYFLGPLNSLGDYVWSSATTAQNLPNGISSSFVQAPNGFPSYGTVINARTYSGGGGGGLQIYAPYGNGYGGTSLQYRLADYSANTADPPWTPWKTIADSDNGYQGAAFVPSGAGMTMIGPNAITRYGGGGWDGQVYSKEGFTGGAYVSTVVKSLSYSYMFGLNTDPTTDASYCSIDFAWYVTSSTNGYIYESCGNPASGITLAVGDVLAISYDGANIKYIQNGIVRRTVTAYITNPLYFDSSFVNGLPTGPTISNIQFNALTGSSCRLISYSGGTTACPTGYYTWSGTALASGYMLCCRVENPI